MNASGSVNLEGLLEAKTKSGMTALLIAVDQRDFPLIELLIRAGADTKAMDCNGDTAMILATKNPSQEDCHLPKDLVSPSLHKVIIF
jgi:ankyrin repeat protein